MRKDYVSARFWTYESTIYAFFNSRLNINFTIEFMPSNPIVIFF